MFINFQCMLKLLGAPFLNSIIELVITIFYVNKNDTGEVVLLLEIPFRTSHCYNRSQGSIHHKPNHLPKLV